MYVRCFSIDFNSQSRNDWLYVFREWILNINTWLKEITYSRKAFSHINRNGFFTLFRSTSLIAWFLGVLIEYWLILCLGIPGTCSAPRMRWEFWGISSFNEKYVRWVGWPFAYSPVLLKNFVKCSAFSWNLDGH